MNDGRGSLMSAQRRSPADRDRSPASAHLFAQLRGSGASGRRDKYCHQYRYHPDEYSAKVTVIQQYRRCLKFFHHLIYKSAAAPITFRWKLTVQRRYLPDLLIPCRFIPQLKFAELSNQHHFFSSVRHVAAELARSVIDLHHPSDIRWHGPTVNAVRATFLPGSCSTETR